MAAALAVERGGGQAAARCAPGNVRDDWVRVDEKKPKESRTRERFTRFYYTQVTRDTNTTLKRFVTRHAYHAHKARHSLDVYI